MKLPIVWIRPSLVAEITDLEELLASMPMNLAKREQVRRSFERMTELCEAMDDGESAEATR